MSKSTFIEAVNTFLPSRYQVFDIFKFYKELNNHITNAIKDRDFSKFIDTDAHKYKETKKTRIEVDNATQKKYLIDNDWFKESEIHVNPSAVSEATLKVYSNNNFRELRPEQTRLAQDAAFARLKTDPLFFGAIKQLSNYIVGTGVKYTTKIPNIDNILEDFEYNNKLRESTSLAYQLVFKHLVEGEQFILCSVDPLNGDVYINWKDTFEIVDWEYHPKNRKYILSYQIQDGAETTWVADYRYFDDFKNKKGIWQTNSEHDDDLSPYSFIIHLKENIFETEFRGRPFAMSALKYLKWAEDFLQDRVVLNHERSRVVWIRTLLGTAKTALANFLAPPPGGVMLNQTEDIKYDVMKSEINANDVKSDYLAIIYAIASTFMMPISIFNMRADEQVYSSVQSAKSPFSKAILTWQELFGNMLNTIHGVVIREKVKANELEKSYTISVIQQGKRVSVKTQTNRIPIVNIFPSPINDDLAAKTQQQKFELEYDIASLQTIREQNGYDSDEERLRIESEKTEREDILIMKIKPANKNEPTGAGSGTGNNPRVK